MDPRLLTSVAASHAWYADVFALHGIPTATDAGLWRALATPPPLHSAAKTLVPGVREADAVAAVAPYEVCSIADSFGDLDLSGHGFDVLIDATWLLHEPLDPAPLPAGWERVSDTKTLAVWVDLHGTPGVFPDAVLEHPAFTVLARGDGAGAVVHAAEAAVTVAHVLRGREHGGGVARRGLRRPWPPAGLGALTSSVGKPEGFSGVDLPTTVATMAHNVEKTDEQWRAELTPEEYQVLRKAGTERAFTGEYTDTETTGVYRCKACQAKLFESDTKFHSGCGWPSFYQPISDTIEYIEDTSFGQKRVEVRCANCGSHLGHVFPDGYGTPTGDRYCINSISLTLEPADRQG